MQTCPLKEESHCTGIWDLSTPYARELKAMSLEQRKQESARRVQAIINAGPSFAQTLDRVKATTRQPEPYRHPSKLTVPEVLQLRMSHPNVFCMMRTTSFRYLENDMRSC